MRDNKAFARDFENMGRQRGEWEAVEKAIDSTRAVNKAIAADIDRAFYELFKMFRAAGHSAPKAAKLAIDEMNRALQS